MEHHFMMQLLMLCLAFVAVISASRDTGCGPLQRLRVKSDWAAAYGSGRDRMDFALVVWNYFLKAEPEYRSLFVDVGGNYTKSPTFKAHMARVLGGVDLIISVLEIEAVAEEVLKHYSDFHKSLGHLPYKEFGDALAKVIRNILGRNRFNLKAWNECFKYISEKMAQSARTRQSPIDITQDHSQYDPSLRAPWDIHYIPENTKDVMNNGHTVQVNIDYKGSRLSGGPLAGKTFCLQQFHFHWGSKNTQGSEHTVQGYAYPAEFHLVHWNCGRYSSFSEAVPSEDGLAVLGIFLQVGEVSNPALKQVTDTFSKIHYKGQSEKLNPFDPRGLLPGDITSYWNYDGSLTTPPYSETVNWIVFTDPITITQEQLNEFRHLMTTAEGEKPDSHSGHGHHAGPLVDNFRKTQPLFGRVIHQSFS